MLQITPTAVQEIKRIQRSRQQTDHYLRVQLQPGGCLDYIYRFSLEDAPKKGDRLETIQNIQLLISHDDTEWMEGLRIDYAEDLMGGSFRFNNPNLPKTCNCGQSFEKAP